MPPVKVMICLVFLLLLHVFTYSFVQSMVCMVYSKTCLKRPLKKETKIGFQDRLSLKAGQKYENAPRDHPAILSTFIKLLFVFEIFVLSIFEWPLMTGFTVYSDNSLHVMENLLIVNRIALK